MENYQKISKWKNKAGNRCQECRQLIDSKEDNFMLATYWKIKKKADEHHFCSLKCLKQWIKED